MVLMTLKGHRPSLLGPGESLTRQFGQALWPRSSWPDGSGQRARPETTRRWRRHRRARPGRVLARGRFVRRGSQRWSNDSVIARATSASSANRCRPRRAEGMLLAQ